MMFSSNNKSIGNDTNAVAVGIKPRMEIENIAIKHVDLPP